MYVIDDKRGITNTAFTTASTTSVPIDIDIDLKQLSTRRRSSSWTAAFYSSTIVPALSDNEALSSLITSLASISSGARVSDNKDNLTSQHQKRVEKVKKVEKADIITQVTRAPAIHNTFDRAKIPEIDFCPPPVAGYTTSFDPKQTSRPKTSGNDTRSHVKFSKKSQSNLRAIKTSRGLQSPDSFYSALDFRSSGNESDSSLPLSVNSKPSRTKSPLKMFFSSRLGESASTEQDSQPNLHKPSDASSDSAAPITPITDVPDLRRISAFVHSEKLADSDNYHSDSKTLSSISPSVRADLGENLIPSRRSSLRNGTKRLSSSSRDLKSLNIDQDLIEENDSTVQRIRELQQAREKRHKEWRKEARKSERSAKRMSLSSHSPGRQSSSARNSCHSRVSETPHLEEPPALLSQLGSDDAFGLPASVEALDKISPTPMSLRQQSIDLKRDPSLSTSMAPSLSSIKKHTKRLSGTIRRSSSLRHSVPDDVKTVTDEVEAYLASPRLTQKVRHPRTGRTIAFSEVGDPNGFVVICCVGMGLTRYVTAFYDDIARAQKLRIITPDRPAVGETSPMPEGRSTPLAWVDDVAVICSSLGIEKFSLLAHSAGTIYALATALKMPQYIRGRIHLLAPWIPPSQLAASQNGHTKPVNLPTSHKILSFLPVSFMKAANSKFLTTTNTSIEPANRKQWKKDHAAVLDLAENDTILQETVSWSPVLIPDALHTLPTPEPSPKKQKEISCYQTNRQLYSPPNSPISDAVPQRQVSSPIPMSGPSIMPRRVMTPHGREKFYNTMLTQKTWSLATSNANPAVDLVICLERRRSIGFRYTDITRSVVIHHGAKDSRVPLENVRWLSGVMKRCELRVLENEGHGLLASAAIMSNVLAEVGKEWEEWNEIVKEKERERLQQEREEQAHHQRRASRKENKGFARW